MVKCVVDVSGPSDFSALAISNPELFKPQKPAFKLLGGRLQDRTAQARAASPVTYIAKEIPPFLIIHGTNDTIVSIEQSELMSTGLRKAGVDVSFIKIQGGGHKLEGSEIDGPAKVFFDKHLLGRQAAAAGQVNQ